MKIRCKEEELLFHHNNLKSVFADKSSNNDNIITIEMNIEHIYM